MKPYRSLVSSAFGIPSFVSSALDGAIAAQALRR